MGNTVPADPLMARRDDCAGTLPASFAVLTARNEALYNFAYAHAALHGPISMGLRLNEEVERMAVPKREGLAQATKGGIIRSTWLNSSGSTLS